MATVGKVIGVHGIKGELKVRLDDGICEFNDLEKVLLNDRTFFVEGYRFHKKNLLLKLKTVDDRNSAESLMTALLSIDEIYLPPELKQKKDMIGKEVVDQATGQQLGVLTELIKTAVHEVLVVKNQTSGQENLIPFVDKFVKEINDDKITVDMTDLKELTNEI